MLCMNTYPKRYIDETRAKITEQAAAYANLAATASRLAGSSAAELEPVLREVEPVFFNNLLLALDNFFAHRGRAVEGKDGNPLNEVRVMCSAMMNSGGVLTADKTIKFDPARSVLGLRLGDQVRLTEKEFLRLADAFFAELERRFLAAAP